MDKKITKDGFEVKVKLDDDAAVDPDDLGDDD